jgi:hypothetical protein
MAPRRRPGYDARMSLRVVYLLVAVLLLRGWVGEAMAGQMLSQQLQAAAPAGAAAMASHGPDCAGAMESGAAAESAMSCGSCLHCQDCSLNALPAVRPAEAGAAGHAPLAAPARAFASAEPVRGLKPPIA